MTGSFIYVVFIEVLTEFIYFSLKSGEYLVINLNFSLSRSLISVSFSSFFLGFCVVLQFGSYFSILLFCLSVFVSMH